MSERNDKPLEAPNEGAQQAAPSSNRAGFDRAENRLAAGNQDSDARAAKPWPTSRTALLLTARRSATWQTR